MLLDRPHSVIDIVFGSFFGDTQEMRDICPFVTRQLANKYAAGARLVELAALTNPGLVPQAVANALGVREQPGRALHDTVVENLHTYR